MPILVDFKNIASGFFAGLCTNNTTLATMQFTLDKVEYDPGSQVNGTVSGVVYSLGVLGDRESVMDQPTESPILLDILIMLVDGSIINRVVDITHSIIITEIEECVEEMDIDVNILEKLPDVEPKDGIASGFDTIVEEWEGVDVPITNDN